eukprot:15372928-Alexandrium_andersonii.AAC.1
MAASSGPRPRWSRRSRPWRRRAPSLAPRVGGRRALVDRAMAERPPLAERALAERPALAERALAGRRAGEHHALAERR